MASLFRYKARDKEGALISGALVAASVDSAVNDLVAQSKYPSLVKRVWIDPGRLLAPFKLRSDFLSLEKRIGFYIRFATLLKAGVMIREALLGLEEQAEDEKARLALAKIRGNIEEGRSLSCAMEGFIPDIEIALIEAAESAGAIDTGLFRLVAVLENKLSSQRITKEVFRYPLFVIGAVFVAVIVLTGFVIPRYAAIFSHAKIALPAPTRVLMAIDGMINENFIASVVAIAIMTSVFFVWWASTTKGREKIDETIIKLPVVGEIALFLSLSRWANTLSALLSAGVGIVKSVAISDGALGNRYLGKHLSRHAAIKLSEGEALYSAVACSGVAPVTLSQMVEVGERAGSLDESLATVGDYYSGEAERQVKRLAAYIEPVLIVTLGLLVLFVALAVFMPMWEMSRLTGR